MPMFLSSLKSHLGFAALAAGLALAPLSSQAGLVSSRFGALDGLGIGLADGASFDFLDLVNGQPDGTNEWTFGGFAAQIDASFTGTVTGASLQVFSGGWGYLGPAQVFLNHQRIGELSLGEDDTGINTVHLDQFNLAPYLALLGSQNLLEIVTADSGDGGALGWASLSIQTQDAGGGGGHTVPVPAPIWLLGAAAAAWTMSRRVRA